MNISDNTYNMNSSNIMRNGSVEGQGASNLRGANSISGSNGTDNLKDVSNTVPSANSTITQVGVGESFHGQIVNVTNGGEVSIQLDNNAILRAHMAEAMSLNIGDAMDFLVKESDGANVLIKPFQNPASQMKDGAIFKALEMNNFSPTEKNYQIAETLMNNNMSLDKAGMQKIMQQSYKYPDASIDTLVSLNKMGIEVNEATISQYEDYKNNTHQLSKDLVDFSNKLIEFADSVTKSLADNESNLSFQNQLLSAISDAEDMANITSDNLEELLQKGNINANENAFLNNGIEDGNNQNAFDNNLLQNLSTKLAEKLDMNENSIQNLFEELSKQGVSNEELNLLANKSENPMQFLNNLNEIMKQHPETIDANSILSSDSYKEVLKDAVKKKFSLNPSDMKDAKEIEDLYKSIYEKANRLMNSFGDSGGSAGEQMKESAKSMQERLDFIQNLNDMYTYAQIPVQISGKDMNSELFVYMNKKNMKQNKEEVSALLHLDMEHLGPTDVHVSLHGTTVHTRFYVEDEASAKIIDDHMNQLEKAINESGFTLTNEVVTREPSIHSSGNKVVDEMLGTDMEKSVRRYSFDIRT